MDQMHLSSFRMSTGPSSFFSKEIRFPFERQVEFCKAESVANDCGNNRSKYVSSPPLEKLHPMTGNPFDCLEFPKAYVFKDHKNKISIERYHDKDFFSSSLSGIFNSKVSLSQNNNPLVHSVNTTNYNFRDDGPSELLEAIEAQTIGNLLPDNDDLFSGVIDDVGYIVRPNFGDDTEDDLFYSGGGVETEADDTFISNQPSELVGEGASNGQPRKLCSSFTGEHPSRTLFVRNINSNAEDWELRDLFEQFGDIHVLYTPCKHHGFVVISYFDIRAAQNAMRALQNKPFRHQQLDIHFFVPKEYPFDKDISHGALVVFELDSSVSNEALLQIFGVHGDIKEIREFPHDHHRKYVEFYDVRTAEIALHTLKKCDIAGKKIKLEPSCSGGGKQRLMQHLSPELDQEESNERRLRNPPYDTSEFFGTNIYSGLADAATRGFNSTIQAPFGTSFPGVSSSMPYNLSYVMRSATIANHNDELGLGDFSHALGHINLDYQRTQNFHPHSLPEYQSGVNNDILFNSPSPVMEMDIINSRPSDGMISRHIHHTVGSGGLGNRSFEHQESEFGVAGNRTHPLHAHQYVWNGSGTYHHRHHNHQCYPPGTMMRQNPPSFITGIPHQPRPQMHGLPRSQSHLKNTVLPLQHHHADSVENMGFPASSPLYALKVASRNIFPCPGGNFIDPSFSCRGNVMPGPYEHPPNDRVRSRRSVESGKHVDSKKQYELDIDRIRHGEDSRTTLMIKNIPNKYTSKMLLATIDEHHRGTFDFIYLPIDFKNKCNVGYAFINMIDPQHIIAFFQAFNGKKWEKFNSEKVASLAYARIQGKPALVAHFQNSSLMNEDKRCRPVLFHTDGPNAGDQEPFPMGVNIRSRSCRSRTVNNEEGSPANGGNTTDSSSGSEIG